MAAATYATGACDFDFVCGVETSYTTFELGIKGTLLLAGSA